MFFVLQYKQKTFSHTSLGRSRQVTYATEGSSFYCLTCRLKTAVRQTPTFEYEMKLRASSRKKHEQRRILFTTFKCFFFFSSYSAVPNFFFSLLLILIVRPKHCRACHVLFYPFQTFSRSLSPSLTHSSSWQLFFSSSSAAVKLLLVTLANFFTLPLHLSRVLPACRCTAPP